MGASARCGLVILTLLTVITAAFATPAAAVTELVVMMPLGAREDVATGIISGFEAKHPDIRITYQQGGEENLVAAVAAGVVPDVGTINYSSAPEFFRKGLATDLTPFIERDDFDTSILPPNDEALKYQGRWYGVPQAGGAFADRAIYYNRDLFDAAGIPYPTHAWTWDEFGLDARKLTGDTNGDGENDQWGYSFTNLEWPLYVWSGGGEIFAKDGSFALNRPDAVQALEWWADLTTEGVARTAPALPFQEGKVAMRTGAYFQANNFADAGLLFDWSIVEFPRGKNGAVNRRSTHPWIIPTGAQHPEEAWEFLKYWLSDEIQRKLVMEWRFRPPQTKTIAEELAAYTLREPPYTYQPFMGIHGTSKGLPIDVPNWPEINGMIGEAMERIWRGEQSVRGALDAITSPVNALLGASDR